MNPIWSLCPPPSSSAQVGIAIPANPFLWGTTLFAQTFSLDAGRNPLGAVFSNAVSVSFLGKSAKLIGSATLSSTSTIELVGLVARFDGSFN